MNKIYEQAKDLHVRNYVVYGKSADHKLYYESTYATEVKQVDLEDAFIKGALIIDDGANKLVPLVNAANVVKTVDATSGDLVSWTALATPETDA